MAILFVMFRYFCVLFSRHTPFVMRSHYLLQPCCVALCHFAMFFGLFGCCFVRFLVFGKLSKCGNTFPVHCQIWKGAKVQLFQGRKQFLITLPKVAPLHPGFSLFFRRKITKIDHAIIPSEWLDWNFIHHNFSNLVTICCTPPNND